VYGHSFNRLFDKEEQNKKWKSQISTIKAVFDKKYILKVEIRSLTTLKMDEGTYYYLELLIFM
jgi:hypothetical protein